MAVLRRRRRANDDGQAQTKTLGVLVAVMVVAGVVALVLTLFASSNSSKGEAAGQPSGSQVGNQTTTTPTISAGAPSTVAPSTTSAASTSAPSTSAPSTSAPKPSSPSSATAATKVVKYTVKKGDNLTLIASWFSQRGYGLVYDWNKSVIGKNPNLIYPGQTIIVSLTGDRMDVSTATK